MTRDIVLEARNLTKQVSSPEGPLTIVRDISLQVAAGETVAIVGASGAGKSTLLALLAGLDSPSSGAVSYTHLDVYKRQFEYGADYIVVGRPIRDASDPRAAAETIQQQIAAAVAPKP